MTFRTFFTANTNIFPIVNSKLGGQLVTEFNLRSRESVGTDSKIKYFVGPSFTHSMEDYYVRPLSDTSGAVSSNVLEITPGRAVVNGHYIETMTSMSIPLLDANIEAQKLNLPPLMGRLCVGLRVMYSTDKTMAGSMQAEDDEGIYEGIQVVILPETEFKTPMDAPDNEGAVTAHLRLASFNFIDGTISNVKQFNGKLAYISYDRLQSMTDELDDRYPTKNGLNPHKIYGYVTKANPVNDADTWCDLTDSLIVWDNRPKVTTKPPSVSEAEFQVDLQGKLVLVMPHKQVDGMTNSNGDKTYFDDKIIDLPVANYSMNTSGTVDLSYTKNIKAIAEKFNNFYYYAKGGKMIRYIGANDPISIGDDQNLEFDDPKKDLPFIKSAWKTGDYIIVENDLYASNLYGQESAMTSTMYIIIPGYIQDIKKIDKETNGWEVVNVGCGANDIETLLSMAEDKKLTVDDDDTLPPRERFKKLADNIELIKLYFGLENSNYRGKVDTGEGLNNGDYFKITFTWPYEVEQVQRDKDGNVIYTNEKDDDGNPIPRKQTVTKLDIDYYFYEVTKSDSRMWSPPIIITGHIPLAQPDVVGGFINVPDTALDSGYVIRNEQGYLQLLDYALLRTGTLAYQLGQDYTSPSGVAIDELQLEIDDYINNRVAFPNATQLTDGLKAKSTSGGAYKDPSVIHLNLYLPKNNPNDSTSTEQVKTQTLNLGNIDSRFGTSIFVHFLGDCDSSTIVNIENCEKLRIDPNFVSTPTVNLYNCNLYYDSAVIDMLNHIEGLKLWYKKYNDNDPDISVDGLTVKELNPQTTVTEVDYWNDDVPDDNHYCWRLDSVTFDQSGFITGCSIAMQNQSTTNITEGDKLLVSKFILPQGGGLHYPVSRLNKSLRIAGSFVTAYATFTPPGYMVMDTIFNATTASNQMYSVNRTGMISFHRISKLIREGIVGIDQGMPIDAWDPDTWHIFSGSVV